MLQRFAPGPYKFTVESQPDAPELVITVEQDGRPADDPLVIAVLEWEINTEEQREEALATAALFTAAPSLLTACKTAATAIRTGLTGQQDPGLSRLALSRIREAIDLAFFADLDADADAYTPPVFEDDGFEEAECSSCR